MYFEQPDASCHKEGPDSDLVNSALIYVDAMINYLMYRLDRKGYLGCINLVILSDHGGQKLRDDHFMAVENYLDINDTNMEVFTGSIAQINFKDKTAVNLTEKIAPFACQEGHTFRVYTKSIMPKRYHYGNNNRIGDIVIDAAAGTKVFKTNAEANASTDKGDHGYDNRLKEMRAIFGAYGPSVKQNYKTSPFQNIELYNLFTDLMQLPYRAPNNGTKGTLSPILKKPPEFDRPEVARLYECLHLNMVKCGDGCHFELHYSANDGTDSSPKSPSCIHHHPASLQPPAWALHVPDRLVEDSDLCVVLLCNSSMAYSQRFGIPLLVESVLSSPVANIDHRANCTAHLVFSEDEPVTEDMSMTTTTPAPETTSAESLANPDLVGSNGHSSTANVSASTINPFTSLFGDNDVISPSNDYTRETFSPVLMTTTASTKSGECSRPSPANTPNSSWISLFPDNDYSRYISQGQIRVPSGFYHGPWKQVLELIHQYQRHYRRLLMYTGPVYDYNNDGLADDLSTMYGLNGTEKRADSMIPPLPPTHIFLILLRCAGPNKWHQSLRSCEDTLLTTTLSFILPIVEKDLNCLFPVEYLFRHTARIRDIELLTGMEWFTDRDRYTPETAVRLRTYINEQLWQLELNPETVKHMMT